MKTDARPRAAGRVNVNTATAAELEALPGIGPVIARRIVEGRPYRSVEDLERVKGVEVPVRRTEREVAGPGPAGHSRLIAGRPLSLLAAPTLRPGGRRWDSHVVGDHHGVLTGTHFTP